MSTSTPWPSWSARTFRIDSSASCQRGPCSAHDLEVHPVQPERLEDRRDCGTPVRRKSFPVALPRRSPNARLKVQEKEQKKVGRLKPVLRATLRSWTPAQVALEC